MAIRYDQNLNKEIQRVVSNFNKKVARLEKQGRDLLPEKIYVADLKAEYDKRYELKRKLKELQRFSTRGIEEVIETEGGVRTTKYALDNLKRDLRRAKYQLTLEHQRLELKTKPTDVLKRGTLNRIEARQDLFAKNIEKVSKLELQTIKSNLANVLNYDHKLEQFQANLFQALFSEAAMSGVSQRTLNNITNTLSQLSANDLLRLVKEDPDIKAILDYSPTDGNYITQERMRDILKEIEQRLPNIIAEFNS